MMILRALIALLIFCAPVKAQVGMLSGGGAHRTQINLAGSDTAATGGTAGMLINNLKTSEGWRASGNQLPPNELDQNGDVLFPFVTPNPGLGWTQPLAAERPGNWVVTAAGYGELQVNNSQPGPQNVATDSCTGVSSVVGDCNNTACTGYQGYIVGTSLTITAASVGSGCALQVGQPISASTTISSGTYNNSTGAVSLTLSQSIGAGVGVSVNVTSIGNGTVGAIQQLNGNGIVTTAGSGGTTLNYTVQTGLCGTSATALSCTAGVFSFATGEVESTLVNKWGVPTIITADGTGTGGTGTYTVNYAQTIASSGSPIALVPGIRLVWHTTGWDAATSQELFSLILRASTAGARVRWEGEYHSGDEAAYDAQNLTALGTITTADYRAFMSKINAQVLRDLAFSGNVVFNNAGNWSQRRSPQYINWWGYEERPNIFAGTPSYSFVGNINKYTVDWYQNSPTDKQIITLALPAQSLQGANSLFSFNSNFTAVSCTTGAYPGIPVVGGSGSGATVLVVCESGQFRSASILPGTGGNGYVNGDTVTVTAGGGTQTLTVSGVGYSAQFSANNGVSYQPIVTTTGTNLFDNTTQMTASGIVSLTYDAGLGAWMLGPWHIGLSANNGSLYNVGPPEAFIQICAENRADPWILEPTWATDSQADFSSGAASYIKANYPGMHPWFETPDEGWNGAQNQNLWFTAKAVMWMAADPVNWFQTVPIFTNLSAQERGKVASTLGQSIKNIYGDSSLYEVIQGVQSSNGDTLSDTTNENEALRADSYVNQSFAAQSPYLKAPAYNYVTRVGVTNYWFVLGTIGLPTSITGIGDLGPIGETPLSYQWFYGDAATRAALQTTYGNYGLADIANFTSWFTNWQSFATTCAGTNAPSCIIKSIAGYEGGNSTGNHGTNGGLQSADTVQYASGANNSSICALTLAALKVSNGTTTFTGSINGTVLTPALDGDGNGAQPSFSPGMLLTGNAVAANTLITGYVADGAQSKVSVSISQTDLNDTGMHIFGSGGFPGMPLALSNISETGGTSWATLAAAGHLTVGSGGTPQSLPILQNGTPVNCSGFDTLNSATITYTGSANWVNTMRTESYAWPQIGAVDAAMFAEFNGQGGLNPSQLNDAYVNNPWRLEGFDIYGWYQFGNCSACNVGYPSANQITLGGTVTGEFLVEQSLLGKGVYQNNVGSNPTITSCTLGAGNVAPCGTTSGDILTVSQNVFAVETGVQVGSFYTLPLASYLATKVWNQGN